MKSIPALDGNFKRAPTSTLLTAIASFNNCAALAGVALATLSSLNNTFVGSADQERALNEQSISEPQQDSPVLLDPVVNTRRFDKAMIASIVLVTFQLSKTPTLVGRG